MSADTKTPMTNKAFGEAVGCDFTMASRLRNGDRLPGLRLMIRISEAFDLPYDELVAAYQEGHAAFGTYLRQRVFDNQDA